MYLIGKEKDRMARAMAASIRTNTRYRGKRPHPTGTMDAPYDGAQLAFLKALDAWRRRTGALAPDAADLATILRSLGYEGEDVDAYRFEEEVTHWRERNGRRFPPATALFTLMIRSFGWEGGQQ